MAASPLQLRYSVFDQVSVEAMLDYEDDVDAAAEVEPEVEVTLSQSDDNGSQWGLWLTIDVPEDGQPSPPYRIWLRAFGIFTSDGDFESEDERANVVAVNGASILYSAAREFLLTVTGRGPHGHYFLPTRDFRSQPYSMLDQDQVGMTGGDSGG